MSRELKSEKITLKVKPSILQLAETVYFHLNPYSDEARLDELFEMLVVEYRSTIDIKEEIETVTEEKDQDAVYEEALDDIYISDNDGIVNSILR